MKVDNKTKLKEDVVNCLHSDGKNAGGNVNLGERRKQPKRKEEEGESGRS